MPRNYVKKGYPQPVDNRTVPVGEQRAICKMAVTLNGEPAVVSGVLLAHGKVTNPVTGEHAEWSWDIIKNTVQQNRGRFYT